MAETPACCDTEWELIRKILLQFISLGTGVPENLSPVPSDSTTDLYRKILLTLAYI